MLKDNFRFGIMDKKRLKFELEQNKTQNRLNAISTDRIVYVRADKSRLTVW